MRIAKVTLEDVIAKNYDNISRLDIDIKYLIDHLESSTKPEFHFFRNISHRTIDDSLNRITPRRLNKKLSQEFMKICSFNSEMRHTRKASHNHQESRLKR